jgi:hypothetical protein
MKNTFAGEEEETREYVYQPYPAAMYHPVLDTKIVNSDAEKAALGPEWSEQPFPPLPPPEPVDPLALLTARVAELEQQVGELTELATNRKKK